MATTDQPLEDRIRAILDRALDWRNFAEPPVSDRQLAARCDVLTEAVRVLAKEVAAGRH